MATRCELTGKGKQFGNKVSFSLHRTKRVFKPNLQKKTFVIDGKKITMTLSTQAIRSLKKKGVIAS
jgi:ribosomal protein L28